jgi:hypothetical protein
VPRIVGRDPLFGVSSQNGFNGWAEAKRRLDQRLEFSREWCLHDIRRSVQTRMAALGIPRDHVNRVLNHAMGPIDAAYDHYDYAHEKAAALARWSDALARITALPLSAVVNLGSKMEKPRL